MSEILNRVFNRVGPIAALDPTGHTGVYRFATAAGNLSFQLPTDMLGRPYEIQAVGLAIQYAFSLGAAATLVNNQLSAINTGSAVAGFTVAAGALDGQSGAKIVPQPKDPNQPVFLNVVSTGTTGFVEFRVVGRGIQ